jgi:hypothetical protein
VRCQVSCASEGVRLGATRTAPGLVDSVDELHLVDKEELMTSNPLLMVGCTQEMNEDKERAATIGGLGLLADNMALRPNNQC